MEYGYFHSQPSLPPREVMVVRAASVLVTLARPASLPVLGLGTLRLFLGFASTPKSRGLELSEFGHPLFRPESDSRSSYHASRWSGDIFFTNPFVKRSTLNPQLTCRSGNGVVCHSKNTQPVYFVNPKNPNPEGALAPFRVLLKNIASPSWRTK
jgi:hypothetical protein